MFYDQVACLLLIVPTMFVKKLFFKLQALDEATLEAGWVS